MPPYSRACVSLTAAALSQLLLPVVRRGPRAPSERVKSSVLEQCRSRKPQVADSVVARLFALAMLELIFLLLCSDVLQCLFLICCIVPTPGTKLCCQRRQRGVGLACSSPTLNFTCCKARAGAGPGAPGSPLREANLTTCPRFHFWHCSCVAAWLCRAAGRTPAHPLRCPQLAAPPPRPLRNCCSTSLQERGGIFQSSSAFCPCPGAPQSCLTTCEDLTSHEWCPAEDKGPQPGCGGHGCAQSWEQAKLLP